MACEDCSPCKYPIQLGPAQPVALVCNLIPELDDDTPDPLCLTCCGTMCYKTDGGSQEVETTPDNNWVSVSPNLITESVQGLTGGATITFTMEHLTPPGGGNLDAVAFTAITAASIDTFRLTWDQPLVGQIAFVLNNVDVGPLFNIVPAPDSVIPAFGVGGTHQIVYNDITGVNQIDITIDATIPGADLVQFSIDETVPLTAISFVDGDTTEVMIMANICVDPPTRRYFDMSTGDEIVDPDAIASLYNCDIDVTEEEVCVSLDDETFTCIKRTFYASDPVDVFIGPDGVVVNPDSWVPGICQCDVPAGEKVCYQGEAQIIGEVVSLAGDAWDLTSPTVATQAVTLPDGSVLNITLTRVSGVGVASVPGDLIGVQESVGIETPTGPDRWQVSWDKPVSGEISMVISGLDAGETLSNWSVAPDNLPVPDPTGTFTYVWDTSMVAVDQVEFDLSNTGISVPDTINLALKSGCFEQTVYDIREAFVSHVCIHGTSTYRDTVTNGIVENPTIVDCPEACIPAGEKICYLGNNGVEVREAFVFFDCEEPTYRDTVTNDIVHNPIVVICGKFEVVIGYIFDCDRFDNELPIFSDATFTDIPVGTNEITFENAKVALLIRNEIVKAQRVQNQEELHSMPVTPVIITAVGGEVYTFNPNGLQDGTNSTLIIDEASIIAWGANINDVVASVQYSLFDSCDCRAVEVLQWIKDSDEVFLKDVYDLSYDPVTGQKVSLLDENNLLDFLELGPFTGPCPTDLQVMEINALCCNDDLATNNPTLAATRLAWLDAADSDLMYDGGVPIVPTTGNDVDEVRDKLAPGVAPSFVVPANVAPGDNAPPTAPTYVEDGLNGLSVLNFDKNDFDRLRLDTGNPVNDSFTFFYLVSASDPILANHACILAVGPANSDGDHIFDVNGGWQLSRDATEPSFIFRITGQLAAGPGVDPIMIVQTGPYSNEETPSAWAGGPPAYYQIERAIATEAEFFNGAFHLITVSFDSVSGIFSAYFDGDLRLQMDMTPTGFDMGSDYFRLFGNRAGTAYLSGQLAELFFTNTFLSDVDTAAINAYLICKWGIDPSIVAGGLGDLTLAEQGLYTEDTPFVQIVRADGTVIYRNILNGQTFSLPPVPGLAICEDPSADAIQPVELQVDTWHDILCDRQDTVTGLDVYTFDDGASQQVQKLDGLTGAVLEFHNPDPAIEWGHGTIFDASGGTEGFYYLYDVTAAEWHRYDASDITLGSTNLGAFAGDPIVGELTFGAYDPTSSLGYVGNQATTRYRVDFNTSTVTSLAAITGTIGFPSSLSITEAGIHYITSWDGGGTVNRIYTVNPLTGVATFVSVLPLVPSQLLNGADYDLSTLSGFYGISGANLKLYRWTLPNGSDIQEVGDAPATGTLAVGQAELITTRTEFQRVYHKEDGVITTQDHDLNGADYEVVGVAEPCPVEVEVPPIDLCAVPAGEKVCYETGVVELRNTTVTDDLLGTDWNFASLDEADQTYPLDDGTDVTFNVGPSVGIGETSAPNPMIDVNYVALVVQTVSSSRWTFSWDKPLTGSVTLGFKGVNNVPAGSLITIDNWSIAPDYDTGYPPSGTTGDVSYTWNNSLIGVNQVEVDISNAGPGEFVYLSMESATFALEVPILGEAFVSFDCDGIATYRDTISNEVLVAPTIVPCHVSNSVLHLCDTDGNDDQTQFLRHINKDGLGNHYSTDTRMDGTTPYAVSGDVDICHECPCQTTIESHVTDLASLESWTVAGNVPVGHNVTGITMTVLLVAADNSLTDADGTITTNIPSGVSLSWNLQSDDNILSPPQSISAGTNGRILINFTTRDDS